MKKPKYLESIGYKCRGKSTVVKVEDIYQDIDICGCDVCGQSVDITIIVTACPVCGKEHKINGRIDG